MISRMPGCNLHHARYLLSHSALLLPKWGFVTTKDISDYIDSRSTHIHAHTYIYIRTCIWQGMCIRPWWFCSALWMSLRNLESITTIWWAKGIKWFALSSQLRRTRQMYRDSRLLHSPFACERFTARTELDWVDPIDPIELSLCRRCIHIESSLEVQLRALLGWILFVELVQVTGSSRFLADFKITFQWWKRLSLVYSNSFSHL